MSLTEMIVKTREPYAGGAPWGDVGSYEIIRGIARFAVDPGAAANVRIVDLDLVESSDGLARSEADFCIIRPVAAAGARKLIYVVPNRGLTGSLPFSANLTQAWGDLTHIDAGDGFLLTRGWTIAWCGWQWDVRREVGGMGFTAPEATRDGKAIEGQLRVEMRSDAPFADHPLSDSSLMFNFENYPTADIDDETAVLTVRDSIDGTRTVIDRARWRFARVTDGRVVADAEHVWLDGGFEPFRFYELVYRTNRCPVAGAGLLAIRDFVSYLRTASAQDGNPCAGSVDHAIGFGVSQSGRVLRQFLLEGCNTDESGRQVFDGVFAHIGGARTGEFNHRYAQPSVTSTPGFGNLGPFTSIASGPGLLDRQRALGTAPKTFFVNTAWEYWRGDAALVHIDPDLARDAADVEGVRAYLLAGIDHIGSAALMKSAMAVANPVNDLDAALPTRALFEHLDAWVTDDVDPPPSEVPRLADATAVERQHVLAWARTIPAIQLPDLGVIHSEHVVDLGPQADAGIGQWPLTLGARLPAWVSAIDDDGNEIAGIRVPELAAPVATYTGWNPRRPVAGLPDVLYEFVGSRIGFARTAAERAASGDPRPSIEERYEDRDDYTRKAGAAADDLVARGFLLPSDRAAAVDRAIASYDAAVRP
ncbi:MAG: alpha/beta hydrolase domain-containing protein [Acidimicrobiales bacterium]